MFKKKLGVVLLLVMCLIGFSCSSVNAKDDRGHIYYDNFKIHFYSHSSGAQVLDYYVRVSDDNFNEIGRAHFESQARADVRVCKTGDDYRDDVLINVFNNKDNIGKTYYIDAYAYYEMLAESCWSSKVPVVVGKDNAITVESDTRYHFPRTDAYCDVRLGD
jgi:hypothetical protein